MRIINGNLVLDKDTVFEEGIHVKGSILGKVGRRFSLTVKGRLIVEGDITAEDITAQGNITSQDITAWDISAWGDITARDISYYAFCVAYCGITCTDIRGRHENSFHKSLDGKIKIVKGAVK